MRVIFPDRPRFPAARFHLPVALSVRYRRPQPSPRASARSAPARFRLSRPTPFHFCPLFSPPATPPTDRLPHPRPVFASSSPFSVLLMYTLPTCGQFRSNRNRFACLLSPLCPTLHKSFPTFLRLSNTSRPRLSAFFPPVSRPAAPFPIICLSFQRRFPPTQFHFLRYSVL